MGFIIFLIIAVLVIALVILLSAINFVLGIFRAVFSFGKENKRSVYDRPSDPVKQKDKVLFDKSTAEDVDYEDVK